MHALFSFLFILGILDQLVPPSKKEEMFFFATILPFLYFSSWNIYTLTIFNWGFSFSDTFLLKDNIAKIRAITVTIRKYYWNKGITNLSGKFILPEFTLYILVYILFLIIISTSFLSVNISIIYTKGTVFTYH
jgi:hypothetical protein